jgi:hypothetical protein
VGVSLGVDVGVSLGVAVGDPDGVGVGVLVVIVIGATGWSEPAIKTCPVPLGLTWLPLTVPVPPDASEYLPEPPVTT